MRMTRWVLVLMAGVWMTLAMGCSSTPAPRAKNIDATRQQSNHGYALLYSLVGKNQDVDKILIVKKVSPETKAVIKDIASLCKEITTQLDEYVKIDDQLGYDDQGLPRYEVETRDAIESTTTRRLLFSSGDVFEMRLLQTQSQSMDYLSHLALMLAENETDTNRAAYLKEASDRADALFNRVMDLLTVKKQPGSDSN